MNKLKKNYGFTFMEIIVVIGVLIISFPALFSILFSILQQQTKTVRLSMVKREGDYVLSLVKDTVRNRSFRIFENTITTANERCGIGSLSPTETIIARPIFEDIDSNWFRYTIDNSRFSSTSATISTPLYLTSPSLLISNLVFMCTRISSFAPTTIIVSFDICYKGKAADCSSTRGEETANMHYQSYITLRNF